MKYKDPSLSIEERIKDLIPRMTVDEKLMLIDADLDAIDFSTLPEEMVTAIKYRKTSKVERNRQILKYYKEHTRLGVPNVISSEALHGLMDEDATIYPQALTLSQSFDTEAAYLMGKGIGAEAMSVGVNEVWSPVCDLAREPRYGRTEETYGEDDYLASRFAENVVRGITDGGKGSVVCELKHFTGYGNPLGGLNATNSTMGRHDVTAYCSPVFEAGIKAGAVNVMNSYNVIDGIPVVCDRTILTDLLRGEYKLPGFVRADMTSITMLNYSYWLTHKITPDDKTSLELSVKAGCDVQLFDYTHEEYKSMYKELLNEGRLTEDDLNLSVSRVLYSVFKAGVFDRPEIDTTLPDKIMNCEEHKKDALRLAEESMVLLKNDGILPLDKSVKKIALIGPNAKNAVMGDYCLVPNHKAWSLYDGLKELLPNCEINYERGCAILHSGLKTVERGWLRHEMRPGLENEHFGLTGDYFNNHDLSGEPVMTRFDPIMDFRWIYESPDSRIDASAFSVRWTGSLYIGKEFVGRLGFAGDDSVRLYLDGKLIIDAWDENRTNRIVDVELPVGEYKVKIEFKNDARAARVMFGFDYGDETIDKAVELAKNSDLTILALGDSNLTSGENFDRATLDLAGAQPELLKEVLKASKKTVLVLSTGRPVTLDWDDEKLNAAIQSGFSGEMGGLAIAETLFGINNPSGRLTMSYPKFVGQIPVHYSRLTAGGRKYVEMDNKAKFTFGYGLSYSKFEYKNLRLSADKMTANDEITASFEVQNVSDVKGSVCPQMYISDTWASVCRPDKELRGFTRLTLEPGETKTVTFKINFDSLKLLNAYYKWVVEPGAFTVLVGDNANDTPLQAVFTVE